MHVSSVCVDAVHNIAFPEVNAKEIETAITVALKNTIDRTRKRLKAGAENSENELSHCSPLKNTITPRQLFIFDNDFFQGLIYWLIKKNLRKVNLNNSLTQQLINFKVVNFK